MGGNINVLFWSMIGDDESYCDCLELNALQLYNTEWNWQELTNQIGMEINWIYYNVKPSIWNVAVADESDRNGLDRNGSQHENTLWKMMGGNKSD